MKVPTLTEEQLKTSCSPEVLERAEGVVGQFSECSVQSGDLHGKIKGNHGVYDVALYTSGSYLKGSCNCEASVDGLCKHSAALGISYIYTPWIFSTTDKLNREKLKTVEDVQFYIAVTPLKALLDELRETGISTAALSEITRVPMQAIAQAVKTSESVPSQMAELLKMASLYLLEAKISK